MAHDLKPYENITRVFWIRIELKEDQRPGKQSLGDIKDVLSGEKQAIYRLFDIIWFIMPYLENMGIKTPWFWRLGFCSKRKRSKNNNGPSSSITEDAEHGTDS